MRTATNSFSSMPICKSRHAQVPVTSGSRSFDYITVRLRSTGVRAEIRPPRGVAEPKPLVSSMRRAVGRATWNQKCADTRSRNSRALLSTSEIGLKIKRATGGRGEKNISTFPHDTTEAGGVFATRADWKASEISSTKQKLPRDRARGLKVGTREPQSLSDHFHHRERILTSARCQKQTRTIIGGPAIRCATGARAAPTPPAAPNIIRNLGTESNHRHAEWNGNLRYNR